MTELLRNLKIPGLPMNKICISNRFWTTIPVITLTVTHSFKSTLNEGVEASIMMVNELFIPRNLDVTEVSIYN